MKLSPHEIAWLALQFWPEAGQPRIAVAVALAESGGDTDVMGRSETGDNVGQRDHGLWQISGRWNGDKLQAEPDWRDPLVNAHLARLVWEGRRNWKPWSVFNSGSYEKWLPDADHGLAHPFPPPPRLVVPVPDLSPVLGRIGELEAEIQQTRAVLDEVRRVFA